MSSYKASSRHRLYRTTLLCVICASLLASAAAQGGQRDIYGRPTQSESPQTSYKPEKAKRLRAIAVIRWDADVKDKAVPKLIPVCILNDGQFYDASIYKAAPAPMPILAGIVYEAQDKGELLGYFTTKRQIKLTGKENWIALGDWQSASPPMEVADNRKSSVEVVHGNAAEPTGATPGDNNDDRDLNKKKTTVYDENGNPMPEGTTASPAAPLGGAGNTQPRVKTTSDKTTATDSSKTDKKTADDPDRPTIKRQTNSDSSSSPAPAASASTSTQPPQSAPSQTASSGNASETPASSSTSDPDRPKLKRGKPSELPQIEPPKAKDDPDRPVMKHGNNNAGATGKQEAIPVPPRVLDRGPLIGESNEGEPVLHRTRTYEAVAVSDATPEQPNVFRYKMAPSEKEELQAKLDALAQGEVDKYLKSIGRGKASLDAQKPASSKPTARTASRKRATTPAPEDRRSEFAEVQFEVLDLNHRNDPVLVFSGRERTLTASGTTAGAAQDVYVTYVARVGYEGKPLGIYRSVTVNDRLDVTPKLELIDAVDADGDGLGELLFRRVADDGAEFALYKVGFDRMTELFHGGTAD